MSRAGRTQSIPGPGFPRVSGDEPDTETTVDDPTAFSPRERG